MPSVQQGCWASVCSLLVLASAARADMGPVFGRSWSASVASNMTQIGFDMGMVLVNFSGTCDKPATQQAQTVYGDFLHCAAALR